MAIEAANGEMKPLKVPTKAITLLIDILGEYATGSGVMLQTLPPEMNTWVAARVLGIPRLQLLKILDKGDIPCTSVGRMRRVRLADLIVWYEAELERKKNYRRDLLARIGVER